MRYVSPTSATTVDVINLQDELGKKGSQGKLVKQTSTQLEKSSILKWSCNQNLGSIHESLLNYQLFINGQEYYISDWWLDHQNSDFNYLNK